VLAGFHADRPDPGVPELLHIGEQWFGTTQLIGEHTHEVWEFYLQLDGQSKWWSETGEYELQAGSFFAAPPRVKHGLIVRPRANHHFFFAGIDLAVVLARHASLAKLWKRRRCVFQPHGHSLVSPCRQLIREVSIDQPYRADGMRAAMDYVVIEASRLFDPSSRPIVPGHRAVQETRELLDRSPAEPWKLEDLGRMVGVSPNHLVELFKHETGVSPHRYLLNLRIDRAKQLLRDTDRPITQLALDLGFSSSQHFAKMFKGREKITAAAYRQKAQKA
jgi:AraC-like DNA-binding protein